MSSVYRLGTAGGTLQLRYSTSQSLSGLFVQAKIYNSSDTLVSTTNLTESGSQAGRYVGTVALSSEGDYEIFYIAYTDAGHTTESDTAPRQSESLTVTITQSTFGGATLPPSGGITDNDINAIIDGVVKKLNYTNPWDIELTRGVTAGEELLNKAEPKDFIVPKIDLTKVLSSIEKLGEKIEKNKTIIPVQQVQKEPKEINLAPIINAIAQLSTKLEKNKPKENKEVINKLEEVLSSISSNKETLNKHDKAEYGRIIYLTQFLTNLVQNYATSDRLKKDKFNLEMLKELKGLNDNYED